MKKTVMVVLPLLIIAVAASAQQQPLQFNVPYHCSDGTDKIITQCKPWGRGEVCYWRNEQNGRLINEQYNVRSQMDGWLAVCKVQKPVNATTSAVAANSSQPTMQPPPSRLVATPSGRIAAGLVPPYLNNLPSVETVKKQIQGADATDTLERQVAMFNILGAIIQHHVAADRTRRRLTPDEQKVTYAYSLAAYEIEQGYKQTHTKEEGAAFFGRHGQYEMDDAMYKEMNTKLLSAAAVEENRQNDRSAFQQLQAHNEQIVRQNEEAKARAAAATTSKGMPNDPGAVAIRRCLESGRGQLECLGEGMRVGMVDLSGGNPLFAATFLPSKAPGLRLTGIYSAGNFGLHFQQELVAVSCGKLVPQQFPYSVERSGSQITVKIPVQPKPLVLSFTGRHLAGPGPVEITGRVPIGGPVASTSTSYEMQTQTTTTQKQIAANEVPQYSADQVHRNGMEYSVDQQTTTTAMVPTHTTHYEVPTAPKTERCNVGELPATGEMPKISDALTTVFGTEASKSANTKPGLRLNGTYAAPGGLQIEFRADSATLECGEALSSEGYSVLTEGGQLVVRFQNATGPLSFVLQPNGSLTGSGAVEVAGRKIMHPASGGISYVSQNARCTVGTLTAKK